MAITVIGLPFGDLEAGRLGLRRAGSRCSPTSRCARPSAAAPSWSAAAGGARSGSSSSSRCCSSSPGPVLTLGLIFTPLPFLLINLLGALIFSLLLPYVVVGQTLLYFDLQARAEEEPAKPRRSWRPWRPRQFGRRAAEPAPRPGPSG